MSKLEESLSHVYKKKLAMEKVESFKSGEQKDSLSCGLFAMNAIRHDVLKAPILRHKGIRVERVRWFNALCQTVHEMV